MKIKWDTLLTATLVVCALTTTGLVAYREFFTSAAGPAPSERKPVFIENWKSQLGQGVLLGPPGAPVQLIEFADFECPFCATFNESVQALRSRYPDKVALSFVHYPLSMHRFAESAARAAECADEQGQFEAMQDRLFNGQRSFGITPWSDYAAAAGVPDLAAFATCIENTAPIPRVEAGKQLVEKFDIQSTPTVIINGWKLASPPTLEELDKMTQAILSGQSPVSLSK